MGEGSGEGKVERRSTKVGGEEGGGKSMEWERTATKKMWKGKGKKMKMGEGSRTV